MNTICALSHHEIRRHYPEAHIELKGFAEGIEANALSDGDVDFHLDEMIAEWEDEPSMEAAIREVKQVLDFMKAKKVKYVIFD